jgi:NADH dehydrogenase
MKAVPTPHRVVIVGGGFGGLQAAQELGREPGVHVTLVDRRNFHLFQPLLYQVATGALSPSEIAHPLRSVLRRRSNTVVLLGEAVSIDPERREVLLADGGPLPYDSLIVAVGASFSYFGHDDWAPNAPGLKSIEDALEIRRRILIGFEAAEREALPERRAEWLTFVVVGGGPTGVELAGALGEIANDTLRADFRSIDPRRARIILVEALERILPTYPPDRSRSAARQLARLGVEVRTGARIVGVDDRAVRIEPSAGGPTEVVPTRTVLWAAGVLAAGFVRNVAEATGAELDRSGRMHVTPHLTVPNHPEIFVVGDAAIQPWRKDRPVPGVAQGAIQGGKYAARTIRRRLRSERARPFRYQDRGDVAVIGRLAGVTNIPWLGPLGRQGGFTAWLLWLGIHIFYLIGFANRIVVIVRWAWSFVTHGRGARLITGVQLLPPIVSPAGPASEDPVAPVASEGSQQSAPPEPPGKEARTSDPAGGASAGHLVQ